MDPPRKAGRLLTDYIHANSRTDQGICVHQGRRAVSLQSLSTLTTEQIRAYVQSRKADHIPKLTIGHIRFYGSDDRNFRFTRGMISGIPELKGHFSQIMNSDFGMPLERKSAVNYDTPTFNINMYIVQNIERSRYFSCQGPIMHSIVIFFSFLLL